MPGRRSTILYKPSPSVVAVLTFSISAGLLASTVTPGRTAFDESRTTPAMAPFCARASAGNKTNDAKAATPARQDCHLHIRPPWVMRKKGFEKLRAIGIGADVLPKAR